MHLSKQGYHRKAAVGFTWSPTGWYRTSFYFFFCCWSLWSFGCGSIFLPRLRVPWTNVALGAIPLCCGPPAGGTLTALILISLSSSYCSEPPRTPPLSSTWWGLFLAPNLMASRTSCSGKEKEEIFLLFPKVFALFDLPTASKAL